MAMTFLRFTSSPTRSSFRDSSVNSWRQALPKPWSTGFLQLVGHGVPASLGRALKDVADEFFGHYWFNPANNRAIAVHPAIIREALGKVYGAASLLAELNAE